MKGSFDGEWVPAHQPGAETVSPVIMALSVVGNVVLLVTLFYKRSFRQYCEGMMEDEQLRPTSVRPEFRRYLLVRDDDVSGVSGEGLVCEIAEFSDGHAALHWLGKWPLTTPHPEGIKQIEKIHGHNGKTRLVPVDPSW